MMKHHIPKFFAFAALFVTSFVLFSGNSHALSGADFKAGKIIDDVVFTNKSSMTPDQIQKFLESKVAGGSCDTSGSRPSTRYNASAGRYYTHAEWGALNANPAPFVCLTTYRENPNTKQTNLGNPTLSIPGSQSAAEIIWNAAQQYNINPQTLIVLLQKEQSLITDDWPWTGQYASATGAYCPDTAACDATKAGFGTQVREAARLFRSYMADPWLYFIGNNYVLYNPNRACGGTNVVIENLATVALYHYTPYQPNASALNNLYGTGDSCGAYGNRNFWRLFNDWFGSTQLSSKWLRQSTETGQLYAVIDGYESGVWKRKKFSIQSWDMILAYQLQFDAAVPVSEEYLSSFTDAGPLTTRSIGSSYSEIQYITNGSRYFIPDTATCTAWGFNCFDTSQTKTIPGNEFLERLPGKGALPLAMSYNNVVYRLDAGKKHPVLDMRTFNEIGLSWQNIIYPQAADAAQPLGYLQISHQVVLSFGGPFLLYNPTNFQFYPITSMAVFDAWGLPKYTYANPPQSSYNASPPTASSTILSIFAKDGSNNYYIVDGGRRITISQNQLPTGVTVVDFANDILNTLPLASSSNGVTTPNGAVYLLEGGQKRPIASWNDFVGLGLQIQNLVAITDYTANIFPTGAAKLAEGSLFETSTGLYIVSQQQKFHIPTWPHVVDYKLNITTRITGQENLNTAYTGTSELSVLVQDTSSQKYLINNGIKIPLGISTLQDWGIQNYTFQTLSSVIINRIPTGQAMSKFYVYAGQIFYGSGGCKHHILSYSTYQTLGGNPSNTPTLNYQEADTAIPTCAAIQ